MSYESNTSVAPADSINPLQGEVIIVDEFDDEEFTTSNWDVQGGVSFGHGECAVFHSKQDDPVRGDPTGGIICLPPGGRGTVTESGVVGPRPDKERSGQFEIDFDLGEVVFKRENLISSFTLFTLQNDDKQLIARVNVLNRQREQAAGFGLKFRASQASRDKTTTVFLGTDPGRILLSMSWEAGDGDGSRGELRATVLAEEAGIQKTITLSRLTNAALAYDVVQLGFVEGHDKVSKESRLNVHRFTAHRLPAAS